MKGDASSFQTFSISDNAERHCDLRYCSSCLKMYSRTDPGFGVCED